MSTNTSRLSRVRSFWF